MALFSSIFTFSPLFAQIDRLLFQNYNQSITQLHSALLVLTLNRETGVNPVRSRRCNAEPLQYVTELYDLGRRSRL